MNILPVKSPWSCAGPTMRHKKAIFGLAMGLIGVALCGACLVPGFLRLLSRAENPPLSQPAEADRIFNPDGFSLIKPRHWSQSTTPGLIVLSAGSSRRSDFINVFRGLKSPGDTRLFPMNSRFQGRPAYEVVAKRVANDRSEFLELDLVFERQGQFFEMVYVRWGGGQAGDVIPHIQKFLDTFRFDGPERGHR